MDDIQNPSIEGSESFVVFLSSPQGAVLQEPYEANVVITDTFQDSTCKSQTEKNATTIKLLTWLINRLLYEFSTSSLIATVPSFSSQHAV